MTEMEKAIAEVWAMINRVSQQIAETDKQIAETDKQIAKTDKKIDKLTDKWGRFIEYFLAPGIPQIFQNRGILINRVCQRYWAKRDGRKMEIDLLGVNDKYVVAVSVKSTLSVDDVKEHLKDLDEFKDFFPEYKDKTLLGAVAGIEITGEADKFAYKHGLFVIGQKGDTAVITNDEKFKPKEW